MAADHLSATGVQSAVRRAALAQPARVGPPRPGRPEDTIDILVADDNTLFREAVLGLLLAEPNFRVVGEAGSGESAVAVAERTRPDVILINAQAPTPPVFTVRRLRQQSPEAKVIVLGVHPELAFLRELLALDVHGVLDSSVGRRELVRIIRDAHGHDRRVTIAVVRPAGDDDRSDGRLSPREREVLTLVAQAMSNRQIAVRLSITEGTVKRHLRNIFAKLGAVSRIDAVNRAVASSVIRRPEIRLAGERG